jgi:hypothetical protein
MRYKVLLEVGALYSSDQLSCKQWVLPDNKISGQAQQRGGFIGVLCVGHAVSFSDATEMTSFLMIF